MVYFGIPMNIPSGLFFFLVMGDRNSKSIRFSAEVDVKLEKFARKLGRTKLQVFCQMVDYFAKTGKDPVDINDEVLKKSLARNHDAYMRFIKVQEKDLLVPVRDDVRRMLASQKQIVTLFNEQIVAANKKLIASQGMQAEKFFELDQLMKVMREAMSGKRSLKKQFIWILESYAEAREKVSGMFNSDKKQSLIDAAKEKIELL